MEGGERGREGEKEREGRGKSKTNEEIKQNIEQNIEQNITVNTCNDAKFSLSFSILSWASESDFTSERRAMDSVRKERDREVRSEKNKENLTALKVFCVSKYVCESIHMDVRKCVCVCVCVCVCE